MVPIKSPVPPAAGFSAKQINDKISPREDFSIFCHVVIDFRVSSCQFHATFLYTADRQLTRQEKLENLAGGEINRIFPLGE